MIRDAARYLPSISQTTHVDSLFEIKTVSLHHENDDGRPILIDAPQAGIGFFSILGSKIDNIFDILEVLDSFPLIVSRNHAQ
jgi:hypothetical protein